MPRREVHNAIVTRNTDPDEGEQLRGAVYFEAPTLFEGEFPEPALPTFPFASEIGGGFFFVPQVGDEIEIEINVDDPNTPYDTTDVELPEPRWRAMIYSKAADIDDEFKTNYPKRMGWKSNRGNILLFDDTEGEELIRLANVFGTGLRLDAFGNFIENIVRDKIVEMVGDNYLTIRGDDEREVYGNSNKVITKDETKVVRGNKETAVTGEETHAVDGKHSFECPEVEQQIGTLLQTITGSKDTIIDGGHLKRVGGSYGKTVTSNYAKTVSGLASSELHSGSYDATYGLVKKETIAAGGYQLTVVAGGIAFQVTAGGIDMSVAAGVLNLQALAGIATFGTPLGNLSCNVAGISQLTGTQVILGLPIGQVLTNITAPVVDLITGTPHVGVPTVLAG